VPEESEVGAPKNGEETWKSYFSHATSIPHPCSLTKLPPCPYSLGNYPRMHAVSHETVPSFSKQSLDGRLLSLAVVEVRLRLPRFARGAQSYPC